MFETFIFQLKFNRALQNTNSLVWKRKKDNLEDRRILKMFLWKEANHTDFVILANSDFVIRKGRKQSDINTIRVILSFL